MLKGFQMHVRCFFAHGFTQQGIDKANDRRIAFLLQQVGGLRHLLGQTHQVEFFVQPLGHLLGSAVTCAIAAGQALAEVGIGEGAEGHFTPSPTLRFGQCGQWRIGANQQGGRRGRSVQHYPEAPGKAERQARTWQCHG